MAQSGEDVNTLPKIFFLVSLQVPDGMDMGYHIHGFAIKQFLRRLQCKPINCFRR
jgi:hypothetical protein